MIINQGRAWLALGAASRVHGFHIQRMELPARARGHLHAHHFRKMRQRYLNAVGGRGKNEDVARKLLHQQVGVE